LCHPTSAAPFEELRKKPERFARGDPEYCKFVLACLHGLVK
jgi:hypothetical protein